jgi:hypothetical protein
MGPITPVIGTLGVGNCVTGASIVPSNGVNNNAKPAIAKMPNKYSTPASFALPCITATLFFKIADLELILFIKI